MVKMPNMLGYGSRTIKYLLFIFNFIFVLTGIALISVGVVIKGVYTDYERLLDERFFSAPSLLITAGTIIFFIAFFGCCGAVKENHCMVFTFSVLLGAIFIMELVAGVTGYMLSGDTFDLLNQSLNKTMHEYANSSKSNQLLWDDMQQKLHCCGIKNYTDWYEVLNSTVLPMSCCGPEVGAIGTSNCTELSKTLYRQSCLTTLSIEVKENASTLGGAAISIAFVQLLGIAFACILAKSIRESSYESV